MADYTHVNGHRDSFDSDDLDFINENLAAIDLNHVNENDTSNGNNQRGWYFYPESSGSPSPPLIEEDDSEDSEFFDQPHRSINRVPAGFVTHPIIPDDLMTNNANMRVNFLDFPPIEVPSAEIPSAEENAVRYFAVVKTLGPYEEKWAIVRTLDGCDVECSTEGCLGLSRLRPMELCQIACYTSGEREGLTFVTHAAAECTPMPSGAVSRVPSHAGSRRGSTAQSRAQSPDPG